MTLHNFNMILKLVCKRRLDKKKKMVKKIESPTPSPQKERKKLRKEEKKYLVNENIL